METRRKVTEQNHVKLKVRDAVVLCMVILTVAMVIDFSILNQFRQNMTDQRLGLILVEQHTE